MTANGGSGQNSAFLLIIFVLSLLALAFGYVLEKSSQGSPQAQVQQIEDKVNNIEKNINPYTYKDNLNKTIIVDGFQNSSSHGEADGTFTKKLKIIGSLESGFIYVRASVNGEALTTYDDVYLKMEGTISKQYHEYGGHLLSSRSLAVPASSNYTELLFSLSDVQYKNSYLDSEIEAISGDWLRLLNASAADVLLGFSSTVRAGLLQEVSIYYKCSHETPDCTISVE